MGAVNKVRPGNAVGPAINIYIYTYVCMYIGIHILPNDCLLLIGNIRIAFLLLDCLLFIAPGLLARADSSCFATGSCASRGAGQDVLGGCQSLHIQ